MKNKLFLFYLVVSFTLILSNPFFSSCTDRLNNSVVEIDVSSDISTRSAYDNFFDFENSTKVNMVNGSGDIVKDVNLPWQLGVSNMGVPSEWIDENIEDEYSKRMYTKRNYWELLYSNVSETTSYKYIVLYNRLTGILRCFYYILSDPSSIGTTNSVWGIGANTSTSLFNFTNAIAEDASLRKATPAYISTPVGLIVGTTYTSVGFQNQVWYGLEIECAYDPQTTIGSNKNIYLMGRAIDKITFNGIGTSEGNIEGSITSTAPTGAGLSMNFSNMFNKNNSISITNQESVIETTGDKIEEGVKQNNSFFNSLWSNIKSNAGKWAVSGLEAGVKQGLSAVVSSGGTIAANVLGGLFSSATSNNNVSKVDLKMVMNSEYKFEGEKVLPGWTDCFLPIPGTRSESQPNKPLYNSPLGVWNLIRTPIVDLKIHAKNQYTGTLQTPGYYNISKYTFSYSLEPGTNNISNIAINPTLSNLLSIENVKFELMASKIPYGLSKKTLSNYPAYFFLNDEKYYNIGTFIGGDEENISGDIDDYSLAAVENPSSNLNLLIRISFELLNKETGTRLYVSKYFSPKIVTSKMVKNIYTGNNLEPSI